MQNDLFEAIFRSLMPWVLIFGLLSVLAAVFRAFLPRIKGRLGEFGVNFRAKRLDPNFYHLIADITLPTPDGTTQIDHVIVSRYGIFVIETKTFTGWIFGEERQAQWTQAIYKRKSRFQNPLRQNYKHTKTIATLTGIPDAYFKPLVVFSGDCTFKTVMPENVIYARRFDRYIKSFQTPIIKDSQVLEIVNVIREWANTVTAKQKAGHIAHVRQTQTPVSADAPPPACPRCGKFMLLRTSRKDHSRFWGCADYPACRATKRAV